MGLLDRLFGKQQDESPQPDIRFGRYSDSYKEAANYEAWDRALQAFEAEKYTDSYRAFFEYLRNEEEDNVHFREEKGRIIFEFYQGSKKIIGGADRKHFKAESKVARTESLKVGFMRRLIEKNFELKYSRFALDEDRNLTILFDTYSLDGSPYKLYYALKELATNADKQDDLLLEEFNMLTPLDSSHLEDLPESEKEIKYDYLEKEVNRVLREKESGSLSQDQYPGGIAYLLLDLIYKLDFLTKPEGFTMESLERMNRLYFAKDKRDPREKNHQLAKQLKELVGRPREEFFKEMYQGKYTFGITTPVNHDRVVAFIDGELPNMDWYQEHGHLAVAQAIPGYIVGYCLFNYAIPRPDRELFRLYFQVVEAEYFKALGFSGNLYDPASGQFDKRGIRRAVDAIADSHRDHFPKLSPTTGTLQYTSLLDFSRSYLIMIRNLDMTKVD